MEVPVSRPGLFARKSTGLVREVGKFDAIFLNIFYINIPLGLLVFTTAPYIWPGVNMAFAYALTILILLIPVCMYAFLVAAMPRSGGDYLFIGRILHPLPGVIFAISWVLIAALFASAFAAWHTMLGFNPMLMILGIVLNNEGLQTAATVLGSPIWVFLIGLVVLGIAWALNLWGWRTVIPVMRVMFSVIAICLIITVILMATTNATEFSNIFSKYAPYQEVITAAQNAGYSVGETSSAGKVIPFIALGWTVLALFMMPAYIGGELKSPRFTPLIGMMGGMVVTGIIMVTVGWLAYHTFGPDFLGAMSFLFFEASEAYPNLPEPMFFMFAMMLTNNIPLLLLIAVGFIFAIFTGMFVIWLTVNRMVLALSLDRVLPDWLAEVHPRFHTPVRINALFTIICVLFLALYVFGPPLLFGFVYSAALLQAFYFLFTAIAAIFFVKRARHIFEASPFNQRIGRLPVLSLLGILSAIVYLFVIAILTTNSDIGANDKVGVISICIIAFTGIPVYFISRWVNRKRGVDITMAFRELPPE